MLYEGGTDGRGTWMVEWRRRGIRIRRATGETERRKAERVEDFLKDLAERGRWDLLTAIASGGLELRQVYRMRDNLGALPDSSALQRLADVVEPWAAEAGSPHTARGRRYVVARMRKVLAAGRLVVRKGVA